MQQGPMKTHIFFVISFIFLITIPAQALEPNEILIIANSDIDASVRTARYYSAKRNVPPDNLLAIPLGNTLNDAISRANYEKLLAEPIRNKLSDPNFAGKIRCLLTTYGVPIKITGRGRLKNYEDKLPELEKRIEYEKDRLEQLKLALITDSAEQIKDTKIKLDRLQSTMDRINGKETNASVDSELSMVLFSNYELYRWQPNSLKDSSDWDNKTLMVSRLDGPSESIAIGLVDKAVSAERTGLNGTAYIDARGIANDKNPYAFGHYDQSLRDLAALIRLRTNLSVKEENTSRLFEPNECPRTAIYCGWYSLKKYIDSFTFVGGAIGYHISSWEAIDLRDPNSTEWCPAMLKHGITATLGAVSEPYLHAFPEPNAFFAELINGSCLAEAYYRTNPFNSWQLVLIGDPLYRPFKKSYLPR
jgi:uncharacterized protein (TIGR03790 family)